MGNNRGTAVLSRWLALVLAIAVIGMGSRVSAEGAPPEFPRGENITVKVLSYNIHYGMGVDGVWDLKRIGDVLAASGAEVIGLQEIDKHWSARSQFLDETKWLADYLGMHYAFGANLDRDPLEEGGERRQYGTAILSKYPIIASDNQLITSSPREQRGLLKATINVKGNFIHIFNTHLGLSPEERAEQTAEIVEIVGEQNGSIIMGDLNAAPNTKEILILSNAFRDAFAGSAADYTFPSNAPRIRADYIFHSDDLELGKAEVIATPASDHLPVTAEFVLKRSAPFENGVGR
ncbi:endonuclease/exonuclease/phosphatase family protein [Paenibacillus sp. GYB003]|uniref:endonuclease/exonuclease/phosphatase family protein n=1 Tax=Paenibacillus sp. GYB003 TaxID=2994392 RepID=UPI002F96D5AD